jgi:predicted CXXCH cytochrome family protein
MRIGKGVAGMGRKKNYRKPAMIVLAFALFFQVGVLLAAGLPWENKTVRIDLKQDGFLNANRTGLSDEQQFDGYLRNLDGQKVHSAFFLNTNSCASCHISHSAPGENLLFQASVYNTCSSCHFDASLNTYNILSDSDLPGGRFYDGDYGISGRNGVSFHLATGDVSIADAPGADAAAWDKPFNCGSCHAPHGSYGRRQFNVNPNGRAKRHSNVKLVPDARKNGWFKPNVPESTAPWLYYDGESPYFAQHGLTIRNSSGQIVTDQFFVHYKEGYVEVLEPFKSEILQDVLDGKYVISFSKSMLVDIEVVEKNGKEESIYRSGTLDFCTACHTGYLGEEEGRVTLLHQKFTHVLPEDLSDYIVSEDISPDNRLKLERDRAGDGSRLVCLTCHFAHGTDGGQMTDRNFEPMYPDNGSGAPGQTHLLRFGQIGDDWEACFTCHESGGPFLSDEEVEEEIEEEEVTEEGIDETEDADEVPASTEKPAASEEAEVTTERPRESPVPSVPENGESKTTTEIPMDTGIIKEDESSAGTPSDD